MQRRACLAGASGFSADGSDRLTPLDVARPEFRTAFGTDAEPARSDSVASCRTIRPSTASSASASSYESLMTVPTPARAPLGAVVRRA